MTWKNREDGLAYHREYREKNRERLLQQLRDGHRRRTQDPSYVEEQRRKHRERRRSRKKDALSGYGELCSCCGEDEFVKLTIDHVDGDGAKHRSEVYPGKTPKKRGLSNSEKIHLQIVAEGWPDRYQVLCIRCNASKGNGPSCQLNHEGE